MPESFSKRRRAEHARRRREEAEQVRESVGEPSELVKEIRERRGSSQLKELPGETWEDIFLGEEERYVFSEEEQREKHAALVAAGVPTVPSSSTADIERTPEEVEQPVTGDRMTRATSGGVADRSPEEQEKLVRALVRKFNAKEIEPEAETIVREAPKDEPKCHLCRRTGSRLVLGENGMRWCPEADAATCIRIAQGRLGGVTTGSRSSLSGALRADGNCRNCKKPVKWVKTQRGKKMPVDVNPAPASVAAFELVGAVDTIAFYVSEKKRPTFTGDLYESHFQTCEASDRT